jgi:hypothetical protein
MTMRRHLQIACFLSALVFAPFAYGDDAATAEAQARFKEGLDLADNAKFEEARLKFLQAVAVIKAPALLFNLATAELKTGHDVEAIEHYRAFSRSSANDTRITDAMRDKAKQNIADLLKKVAQVEIEAPDGAKISVDGKPHDDAKEPIAIATGKHTIEAAFNGRIKSVTVDGKVGQVEKAKLDFDAPAGDEPPPAETSGERSTAGWVIPIALGAVGLAGVVTGVAFGLSSQSAKDDADNARRPGLCAPPAGKACADYDDNRSLSESNATISWVGYVAGGALLAAAAATFVLWPSNKSTAASRGMPPPRRASVTPLLGPQGGGANFKLVF